MASVRAIAAPLLSSHICVQCRRTLLNPYRASSTASGFRRTNRALRPAFVPLRWQRWHSAPASNSKVYQFEEIKQMADSPSPDRILIDVREPSEVQEGYIPTAINIPIKSQPDALMLPEEEFEDRFGFSKPDTDKEVVFYCRSGVRSSAAAQFAQQHGYQNVAEYRGSWLDWQEKGGPASRP